MLIPFVAELFITYIYQPFLNILVFFYWVLDVATGKPDMGVAVILLSVLIRVLLLPLSLASSRTEGERRKIADEIREIEEAFSSDPIKMDREKKKVLKINKRVLISELMNLTIQVMVAVMLWKIFASGLGGEDVHLIYGIMPDVHLPFNLNFLGTIDLTHTSLMLNVIQTALIFLFEVFTMVNSPYPASRGEVVRMQLILPFVSFIIFMSLPAGKKLFVITSLIFSIILQIIKMIVQRFQSIQEKWDKKEDDDGSEKLVVETK